MNVYKYTASDYMNLIHYIILYILKEFRHLKRFNYIYIHSITTTLYSSVCVHICS